MNRKNSGNRISSIIVIVAIILISLISDLIGSTEFSGIPAIVIAVLGFVIIVTIFSVLIRSKKTLYPRQGSDTQEIPQARKRYTETEEAIHCTHSRGKQKYLEQIDSFLSNGIIDKDEYRVLRERYENLDLPDDFH